MLSILLPPLNKPAGPCLRRVRNLPHAISDGSTITRKVKESDLPLSLSLGVLGLNGVTAYFGLLDVGQPRPGDTVVVSTAAGAVGSAVGQIGKLMGCRTVGITGGPIKSKLCREEFGYDEVIDYKSGGLADALGKACPRGVDVRQHGRRDQRCGANSACRGRPGRYLRHSFSRDLGSPANRPPSRAPCSGEAGANSRASGS